MTRTPAATVLLAGLLVAAVLSTNAVTRDREYRRLIRQGEAALGQAQTFQAIEAFSGALTLKPESMLALLRRGEAHRRRGDLPIALRDLREASRLAPTATRPLEELGDVNYALDRDANAAGAYEAYLRLDDRSGRVLYKLGLARYRARDPSAAIAALRRAVALEPALAEAHYLLGLSLAARQQTDEAIESLERTVALEPALAPPREELADLYAARGRRQEEVQQLEALAALDPSRVERHIALGLAYARNGHSDMAVMSLGRAAERLPNQPDIYVALGRVWLRTAEERSDPAALRKAIEAIEPIATHFADHGEALALYGRALVLAGDAARAEPILTRAVARLPVAPEAFLWLAEAAGRLGHAEVADRARRQHQALVFDGG
jgi:tetratricopeptide (TPR) repeat protein